jgi:N-acylneuraminate cytidylyltransferase
MAKIIAIIPARGGSKAVPKKNLYGFAGKPLIAHMIEHAKQARSVNRVVVSTDDPEIASVSRKYGSEVVWRPKELSTDTVSSELALLHVLRSLQESEAYEPDIVIFLQCTSPLILPEDIDGTVKALLDEDADSALTVTPFHGFLWRRNAKGKVEGINHNKFRRIRRQDLKKQYQETGAIYVVKREGFLKAKNRFFGKLAMHVIPQERSFEINDLADFCINEALFNQRRA